jgi:hypothetical protein
MTRLTGSVALTPSLPVDVFDEVCSGHHCHQTRARHVAQRQQIARAENYF